jgi:hypothetical protein
MAVGRRVVAQIFLDNLFFRYFTFSRKLCEIIALDYSLGPKVLQHYSNFFLKIEFPLK